MNFAVMTVFGHDISKEVQREALESFIETIRVRGCQPPAALQHRLESLGVPDDKSQAYRGADRLLQKARRAELIVAVRGKGWGLGPQAPDGPLPAA
jgi:hypothetical protein